MKNTEHQEKNIYNPRYRPKPNWTKRAAREGQRWVSTEYEKQGWKSPLGQRRKEGQQNTRLVSTNTEPSLEELAELNST